MANKPHLSDEERANLVAYLDGELDENTARSLEAKLTLHPQARTEAEILRQTWQMLEYLPKPEPSPEFTARTLERVSAFMPAVVENRWEFNWRPWGLGLGWAAAVLLAGAAGMAGGKFLHPRQPEVVENQVDLDQALVRDLGVIENRRLYDHVGTIEFLRALANSEDADLFGDDNLGL